MIFASPAATGVAAEQPADGCGATSAAFVAFAIVVVVDAESLLLPLHAPRTKTASDAARTNRGRMTGILARPLRRGTSHRPRKVPSLRRMTELGEQLIDALTALSGAHPGYRAAHAQGVCASGTFTGTAAAADLSRAVHLAGGPVPATVRFSNGNGDPTRADGEPDGRGMAVKLRADDGTSYDLVALSLPVFFVRTVEDFLAFTAARVPDPATGAPDPERVGAFITAHPEALPAVQASLVASPPPSYVAIPYFGIHAFRFVDAAGVGRFARYRWEPDATDAPLTEADLSAAAPATSPRSWRRASRRDRRRSRSSCSSPSPATTSSIPRPRGRRPARRWWRGGWCSTPSLPPSATASSSILRAWLTGSSARTTRSCTHDPRPTGSRTPTAPAAEPGGAPKPSWRRGAATERARRVGSMTSATMSSDDRYTIISADCHAGASHEMYREYLEKKYLDDFDAWREKYRNPFRDLQDGGRVRNWDDERRIGDQERDGIVGEVVFPNTVPPFFPSFVLFARPPNTDGVRAPARRHPRPQPLDGRLVRAVPRASCRHRPDLPERRRRRDRRRASGSRSTACAVAC